jgi:hypothetical protein
MQYLFLTLAYHSVGRFLHEFVLLPGVEHRVTEAVVSARFTDRTPFSIDMRVGIIEHVD